MAGAGYKLFNTGDVLTAAQVNTYLNEQTVMVFASSAARTSALSGVLAEGMMSYLQDTNAVEVYNGSSWVNVGNAGDITEVQAGTGISVASGTGPIPVITNTVATAFDAAGDLVYGTGADTFTKLSLGTAGKVLTVNSGATAPEWATPAGGGGKVLQVVNATTSTATSSSSSTFADTTLTATITPTSATSTILVLVSQNGCLKATNDTALQLRLLRGATVISNFARLAGYTGSAATNFGDGSSLSYLDSPATTSATTYKTQLASQGNNAEVQVQLTSGGTATMSTITLLEIGA